MRTVPSVGDHTEDHASGCGQAGPTVLRMLVGAHLRRLRTACGITREEAGRAIRASDSKISRLELGRTGFKQRDVADLLTLYGVTEEAERETLLALAVRAGAPGWWHEYGDAVPHWFDAYLDLEQAACVIRTYQLQFVPGLLQTEDYARAVIASSSGGASPEGIERRVALRMRRQRLLHRPDPPRFWAVIDEVALRRLIGGRATMRAQIERLIELAELPHVTIQIMPFGAIGHAETAGPITVLRFPEGELPDVVYLEQLSGAVYLDKEADTARYRYVMNRLSVEAGQPSETAEILHRILAETGQSG
ncbi:helix-turn-helix domain-containing protein [Planomonospora parontospora]|uniref:helix-turn-helix domain-containing protein n=1 Tax=Planomonospora parontospora TaxID=58119 RepID=UPI00198FF06E|nr:helix-turn-helix transcriptional regulator [Planomonospora parontospora]GGL55807.1 transcriptional regulator [Planomonospora parontospora subsp. antibiotica]GII19821.1 transcriptional regulator [Planomonospora parontospora subsp. antibiotica]